MGVQIPCEGAVLRGKGRPIVKYRDTYHELCKNGCNNQDAIWVVVSGGPKKHALDGGPDPPYKWTIWKGKGGGPLSSIRTLGNQL